MDRLIDWLTYAHVQVVLPQGMAGQSMHSAAGLQILSGETMVNERTVEQVLIVHVCMNDHVSPAVCVYTIVGKMSLKEEYVFEGSCLALPTCHWAAQKLHMLANSVHVETFIVTFVWCRVIHE